MSQNSTTKPVQNEQVHHDETKNENLHPETAPLIFQYNTSYLEFLLTGKFADITIFAPVPQRLISRPVDGQVGVKINESPKPTTKPTTTTQPQFMRFDLHRFIIAARSPVLAILLQQQPIIRINTPSDVFQALIWLMYTDDITTVTSIPLPLLPEILWAAEYYSIRPAQVWSLNITSRLATVENCVTLANDLYAGYYKLNLTTNILTNTQQVHNTSNTSTTNSNKPHSTNDKTFKGSLLHEKSSDNAGKGIEKLDESAALLPAPIFDLQTCPPAFRYLLDFIATHISTLQQARAELLMADTQHNTPQYKANYIALQSFTKNLKKLQPAIGKCLYEMDSTLYLEDLSDDIIF